MGYIPPGVRTYVTYSGTTSGITPFLIPCIVGVGDNVFTHRNIELTYEATGVTYIPTSAGLDTVVPNDTTKTHAIVKIGNFADGKHYIEGVDYIFVAPSAIIWLPGGAHPETNAKIYVTFKAGYPATTDPFKVTNLLTVRGSIRTNVPDPGYDYDWSRLYSVTSPGQLSEAAAAATPSFTFLYGGLDAVTGLPTDGFYRMVPVTETWVSVKSTGTKPPALAGASMAYHDAKIYLFGGTTNGTAPTDTFKVFDPATNVWADAPATAKPAARKDAAMASYNGVLYLFGGTGASGILGDLWAYDGTTWTQLTPSVTLPLVAGAALVPIATEEALFLFGGKAASSFSNKLFKITPPADGTTHAITAVEITPTGTSKPSARSHMVAGVVDSQIWVFGGYNTQALPYGDLWRYDPDANKWTYYTNSGVVPDVRSHVSGAVISGKIYFYGGRSGDTVYSDTWILDPYTVQLPHYVATDIDWLPSEDVREILNVSSFDGMTIYTPDVDYELVDKCKIQWLSANRPEETKVGDITTYYRIAYTAGKTDTDETDPFSVTLVGSDESQVEYYYGGDFKSDGTINELSLASRLAIQAGAQQLYILQVRPSLAKGKVNEEVDFNTALQRLEKLENVWRIVPLSDNIMVVAQTLLHCQTQSSVEERHERTCFVQMESMTDVENMRAYAQNLHSERAQLVFPNSTELTLSDGKRHILPGYMLCAVLAGYEAQGPVNLSLTNCELQGLLYRIHAPEFTSSELNYLAAAGVMICTQEKPGYAIHVRHFLTTNVDTIQQSEGSIIRCVDYMCKYLRSILKCYIGRTNVANSPELLERMKQTTLSGIAVLKNDGALVSASIADIYNPSEFPTTVILTLDVYPPYPCNYIRVNLNLL